MIPGRVVGDNKTAGVFRVPEEDVGLGRVEVSAAGVDPKGPCGGAGGLPGGEGEGVEEEVGEGVERERLRRRGRGVEEGRVVDARGHRRRRVGERDYGRRGEAEEGIGLVGPVEAARAARVAGGEAVLGAAVVVDGSQRCRRRRGGGGSGATHGETVKDGEERSAARGVVRAAEEHFGVGFVLRVTVSPACSLEKGIARGCF